MKDFADSKTSTASGRQTIPGACDMRTTSRSRVQLRQLLAGTEADADTQSGPKQIDQATHLGIGGSRDRGDLVAQDRLSISQPATPTDLPVQTLQRSHRTVPEKQTPEQIHEAAKLGISGPGGPLPYLDHIQRAFGHHDLTGVIAHTNSEATASAREMGALAYTTGNHVAFAEVPSLHTAAHEAAHVVQQRAGVSLEAGIGHAGDHHEQQADAVANAVVLGASIEPLLDANHDHQREGKISPIHTQQNISRASSPGLRDMTSVQLAPSGKLRSQESTESEKALSAEEKLESLSRRLSINEAIETLKTNLESKILLWETELLNLGKAYETAYNKHNEALEKQSTLDSAIFCAVLSIISVGSIGSLGELLGAGKIVNFIRKIAGGAIEDSIQTLISETIDIAQIDLSNPAVSVSSDPLRFHIDIQLTMNKMKKVHLQLVKSLQAHYYDLYIKHPRRILEDKYQFIPGRIVNMALDLVRDEELPNNIDESSTANELERAFWVQWIPSIRGYDAYAMAKAGIETPTYKSPGRHIQERLNQLGITQLAGIGQTFGLYVSDNDCRKLIDWARSYHSVIYLSRLPRPNPL